MPQPRFKFINDNIQVGIEENPLLQIENVLLSVLRLQKCIFFFKLRSRERYYEVEMTEDTSII